MFVDVELHESTDGSDAVERVEEQPLMFERPPPRLDHGVREPQLRKGQHTAQNTGDDQFIDLGVHVLNPGIRQYDRGGDGGGCGPTGVEQHGHAVHGRERLGDSPRQDPSREVVDHSVQIGAGPVQQANDSGVDMPHLIGSRGSKPDLGFHGVHAEPGPSPGESPHEAVPGRGGSPDRAEPLGQDRQRPGGHVTVLGGRHHVLDHPDLRWRQSMRGGARTGRLIVECTRGAPASPRVEPTRR